MAEIPIPKEILDQMKDHHEEQLKYHSKMLDYHRSLDDIYKEGSNPKGNGFSSSASRSDGTTKDGSSPLGGKAK
jgi:hypothetical protein